MDRDRSEARLSLQGRSEEPGTQNRNAKASPQALEEHLPVWKKCWMLLKNSVSKASTLFREIRNVHPEAVDRL
jgi:hypothetical protein